MTITERVAAFRRQMQAQAIDIMIVPTADPHHSEYLPAHYQSRVWLSGFTGSAGTMVITGTEAVLFTDGRYFIQAENQLAGSGIELMRMRVPGVPTLEAYVEARCRAGIRVGADFALISQKQRTAWAECWEQKEAMLVDSGDLFEALWTERPALPDAPVCLVDDAVAGETVESRLARIREEMAKQDADVHVISVLDEIAWTLNVRGEDIRNTPVVLSYLVVRRADALWFVDERKVGGEVRRRLTEAGVEVRPYETVFDVIGQMAATERFLLDPDCTTAKVYAGVPADRIIEARDPVIFMKCVKNEREIEGLRHCHEQDGAAVTRFMYWLKHLPEDAVLTEMEASDRLAAFRQEQPGYAMPSFDTICAYGSNAAMMHYKATESSNAAISREGFLLIDSGGQYVDGTTDITRTFVMGPISAEQRRHFTAVLRSVIRLASATFLSGMAGKSLDVLARGPIWDLGLDYRCGTGHGVGFRMNVHEGPNSFRWHESPTRGEEYPLASGMVTTDEPGIYLEGQYGIRTENELLCRVREENEYGTFLNFETITYAPVDLDGVEAEAMSAEERVWLNRYHEMVRTRLMPYMKTENEREWLEYATRTI